mgnify:CR=1 FL=1|tara:strand:+ start:390 stop:734 length:345 start_codon:yes stop_codon:yes gene_type:complete
MNEVVRFFSEREAYNLCDKSDSDFWIGNFNASTWSFGSVGVLFTLDEFDQKMYGHLVRKDCTIYRYKTREWHMGSFIIMLNHKNGRAYFVKDYDVDDIEFETKGIKCRFINIII